ncbi:Aldo/keto reductase [Sistotremastrum suecicum HHB10207 ss-3]|uniref:Aldo/keto reductase n=1 Tax=Sistotremastrum suecicum HHB10207 ss-3 TaxID=1314776 RepID=A0A165Z5H7_9AGAM|nr:Aldo/keto reductase [Sistotremastrum suecicum HHB10207 ss-3]
MTARVPLLFGTALFGAEGALGTRNHDLTECQEILDVFYTHGGRQLDASRLYGSGTTEEYLGKLNLRDSIIDTKIFPEKPGDHSPDRLQTIFQLSLKALNRSKVRVFYLHAPDRSVPFEETLAEVDALYREGLFEIFGLSNFPAWEVAEIVGICKARGFVLPGVYQGMYNAITRNIETELIPCIRKFGLRLFVYNPLAGGFFAGKLSSPEDSGPTGGRFDSNTGFGKLYRQRYIKTANFQALELIKPVAEKYNLRLTEIGLRWVQHHSALTAEDGVILGASSSTQLDQNCTDSAKGPLPEEVVQVLDEAWNLCKADSVNYWR